MSVEVEARRNDVADASGAPVPIEVPSWKLVATLAVAGALAGLLLVFVHQLTQPRIQAYKAEMLRLAIHEVLDSPSRFETLYVHEGRLVRDAPAGVKDPERVFLGYGDDGAPAGWAIVAGEPGFQDVIKLIFGYETVAGGALLGMKVLESKETPGLGDKIEKDLGFVGQFAGSRVPLAGVKSGAGTGDPHEIDMITGATISCRAIIRIINNAIERHGPLLESGEVKASP